MKTNLWILFDITTHLNELKLRKDQIISNMFIKQ